MIKINIEEELLKNKSEQSEILNNSVSQVKLLLEADAQEDLRIIRSMGKNSKLSKDEEAFGRKLELEKLDKELGKIYTVDQIRKLAIKYKLRFLNSRHFIGNIPIETIAEIKEFSKLQGTATSTADLEERYYILAPGEMFTLNEKKAIAKREEDPVLFYKIDNTHYRLIKQWGNSFSIWRRILGWKWNNGHNLRHFRFIVQSLILSPVLYFLFNNNPQSNKLSYILPLIVIYFAINYIIAAIRGNKYCYENFFEVPLGKDINYHDKYFTPHNWNRLDKLV